MRSCDDPDYWGKGPVGVSGFNGHDRQWLDTVYADCAPDLARYFLRRGASKDEAADLVADVFVVALRRRDEMPSGDESRPWLYGVASRLLLAHHRRERQEPLSGAGIEETVEARSAIWGDYPHSSGNEASVRVEEAVHECVRRLPHVDRELLLLTVWEGLTTADAARSLGLSPGAARVRLHRIRERLSNDAALKGVIGTRPSLLVPSTEEGPEASGDAACAASS